MADNYRIKVHVEIERCSDEVTETPIKEEIGTFSQIISPQQAHNIDECEQMLLKTNYAAVRDAFAHHLSSISKEYALSIAGSLADCQVKPYRVEGEIGRITFDCYWAKGSNSPFPTLHAKGWYRTEGFKELALVYGTVEESYRIAAALVNRVRHQEDATPSRTLRDNTEDEGEKIMQHMEREATEILRQHGFTDDGIPTESAADYGDQEMGRLPEDQVERAIGESGAQVEWEEEMASNPVPYEDPELSVNLCLDDVGVKRQKERRKGDEGSSDKVKYVHNTIAHIAHGGASYIINGRGFVNVLRLVLAFLLYNHLLQYNLIFFVDGQRTLYKAILSSFGWFKKVQIILDWYHLQKRCKEQLSLALKGRVIRNMVLDKLLPCLWHGCVDRAIALLRELDPGDIKDRKALEKLIGYMERNRSYIPCYSVRKRLGLRNSSNVGEKANDLIVSERQKHRGMSWSRCGSVALAALTAMVRNGEQRRWFRDHTLSFRLAA